MFHIKISLRIFNYIIMSFCTCITVYFIILEVVHVTKGLFATSDKESAQPLGSGS